MKRELDIGILHITCFLFAQTALLHILHFTALFLTREPGPGFSSTSLDKIKSYKATEFV